MSDPAFLVDTARQMLTHLSAWVDRASAGLASEGRDPAALLGWRLAPDMYPLAGQIRFACFLAREPLYLLMDLPLPQELLNIRSSGWSSNESPGSLAGAHELLTTTIAGLDGANLAELTSAMCRPLALELPDGHAFDLTRAQYLRDWALPQFYFHIDMAYAILRSNGIPLGKQDYVPHMFAYLRSSPQV